jgi:hypothetical protein
MHNVSEPFDVGNDRNIAVKVWDQINFLALTHCLKTTSVETFFSFNYPVLLDCYLIYQLHNIMFLTEVYAV